MDCLCKPLLWRVGLVIALLAVPDGVDVRIKLRIGQVRVACIRRTAWGRWRGRAMRDGMLRQLQLRYVEAAVFERWSGASRRAANLELLRVLLVATAVFERWRGYVKMRERNRPSSDEE